MEYKVSEVSKRSELKDFFSLPFEVYANDKNWVAPITSEFKRILNMRKNPYFKNADLTLFNCYADGKICSRTAVIINHGHFKKFGTRIAYFGFFEALNDIESVKYLFSEVEKHCKERNMEAIEGPFDPNHYSELGLLVDKFEKPVSFFQTYNPPYYESLLKQVGFGTIKEIHTRTNNSIDEFIKNNFPQNLQLESSGYKIRSMNQKNLQAELENLREIYNDAFSSNWHFIPVSKEEYLFSSKYLSLVTDPEHIIFCEHNGKPVGVIHFALDINPLLKEFKGRFSLIKYFRFFIRRKKINKLIFFAAGIKKAYWGTRVSQLLLNASVEMLRKYKSLETTWMYKENISSVSMAERLGLHPDKEFIILQKTIS